MGLGIYVPLRQGNPGWRLWVILIVVLVLAIIVVRAFYRGG